MNRLTAVFLQQLYEYVPQKSELLQCAQKELLRQLEVSLSEAVSPGTVFFSTHAQQLKQKIEIWKSKAEGLCRVSQIGEFLEELEALCACERQLHEETQQQIRSTGFVDAARLHLFYHSEQRQALDVVNEMIRVELFRVAALGGPERFRRIPEVDTVPDTLTGRLGLWKQYIQPALQDLPDNLLYGCWAFQEQNSCPTGPLGKIPGYLLANPDKKAAGLLPGEWKKIAGSKGYLYQGGGRLTNLTPNNVQQAQGKPLGTTVPVEQLAVRMRRCDPIQAMQDYFGNAPYSVDPYELFAAADLAASANTILERGQTGSCFLCGAPVRNNAPLCRHCVERVYIK